MHNTFQYLFFTLHILSLCKCNEISLCTLVCWTTKVVQVTELFRKLIFDIQKKTNHFLTDILKKNIKKCNPPFIISLIFMTRHSKYTVFLKIGRLELIMWPLADSLHLPDHNCVTYCLFIKNVKTKLCSDTSTTLKAGSLYMPQPPWHFFLNLMLHPYLYSLKYLIHFRIQIWYIMYTHLVED